MKQLYLVGFMGCGKSTLAKRIAKKNSVPMISTDQFISDLEELTIAKIFEIKGEDYFRQRELQLVKKILESDFSGIVECGGAIGARAEITDLIEAKQNALKVFLDTERETCISRVENSPKRPLAKSRDFLEKLYDSRREEYLRSAQLLDGKLSNDSKEDRLIGLLGL